MQKGILFLINTHHISLKIRYCLCWKYNSLIFYASTPSCSSSLSNPTVIHLTPFIPLYNPLTPFSPWLQVQIIHIFIDLIGTWEQLSEELREKLNKCLAFNRINKEIEIISLKIESFTCKKETLEKEASSHKVNLPLFFKGIHLF